MRPSTAVVPVTNSEMSMRMIPAVQEHDARPRPEDEHGSPP